MCMGGDLGTRLTVPGKCKSLAPTFTSSSQQVGHCPYYLNPFIQNEFLCCTYIFPEHKFHATGQIRTKDNGVSSHDFHFAFS